MRRTFGWCILAVALFSSADTHALETTKLKVSGLQMPVTVLRDRWGVPHIYAQNQHDLFFAQGYVVATDRLFQMELWKRAGQGRLAELVGRSAIERDRNARLLRYRGDMDAEYSSYAPDAREILLAFVAGINAYIREVTQPGSKELPEEFKIAGFLPEAWKPEDCLSRTAAYTVTENAYFELMLAQLLAEVGGEKAAKVLQFDPPVQLDPVPGVDFSGLSPAILKDIAGSDTRIDFVGPGSGKQGSNNWTISGRLTRTGKPMLANDPHRTIAVPSLRYMVHLVAPGWNVIGSGEPSLPGVAIGHNQNIAWGLTIFDVDQQDLYVEELNPDDVTQYKTEQGWQPLRTEEDIIRVKGAKDVPITLKFTRHGPVLWEDSATHRALALRWAGSEPGTAGYLASLSVDRAKNWTEFSQAMTRWKLPPENMVYADQKGNIGEISAALTPIRKTTGLLPVPGAGGFEWTGFVPFNELPRSFNPPKGYIATANNKTIPAGYPYKVGYVWSQIRIQRIEEVLEQFRSTKRKMSLQDSAALQNDVTSLPATQLIKMLQGSKNDYAIILSKWNKVLDRDSNAGALYELWIRELQRVVFKKLLPYAKPELIHTITLPFMVDFLAKLGPGEERATLLDSSLDTAVKSLVLLQGPDPQRWSWGALHRVSFRHPLDQLAGNEFNLGPVTRPGDGYTVNSTGEGFGSFDQTSGASFRELIDLQNWDRSLAINVPGQSGHPGSLHYADLLPLWSKGEYFPLSYSKTEVEKNAEKKLELQP